MPEIRIGTGMDLTIAEMIDTTLFIGLLSITSLTTTRVVYGNAGVGHNMIVTGTGLTASGGFLTAGSVSGIEYQVNGVTQFTMTGLAMLAQDLMSAIQNDAFDFDTAALENLFLPLGYHYFGSALADVLTSTSVSNDNVLMNLSGNDHFETAAGHDNIWLGDGDDTGTGGGGNDTFEGGLGNDRLLGGTGGDRLSGDAGNDTLAGGSGTDRLDGGADKDRIIGGEGNDTMSGGAGKDTFVFAAHSGVDEITDFDLANDRIDLPTGAPMGLVSAAGGADTVITFGTFGDQVHLVGVAFADANLILIV